MSALSVLFLVLPFPLAFIVHETEEVAFQHKWMLRHGEELGERFPRFRPLLSRMAGRNRKTILLTALGKLLLVLLVSSCVLVQAPCATQMWTVMFVVFVVHQLAHIAAGIAVRGYVPGIATSILLLPYSYMGMQSVIRFIAHSS